MPPQIHGLRLQLGSLSCSSIHLHIPLLVPIQLFICLSPLPPFITDGNYVLQGGDRHRRFEGSAHSGPLPLYAYLYPLFYQFLLNLDSPMSQDDLSLMEIPAHHALA